MSQAGILGVGSMPSIPTTFVTDVNSPAVPALNILNLLGNDTTANDNDGIRTDGSSGGNTLTVQLTNRLQGQVTTSDATVTTIISFAPTVAGTYAFDFNVAAYNTTDILGAAYSVFVGSITDGLVTMTKLNLEDKIVNEQAGMGTCNVTVDVSGTAILLRVTGIAGKTINWNAVGTYVFRGA